MVAIQIGDRHFQRDQRLQFGVAQFRPGVETGVLRRGGRQPLNTDGGGLSACHPGMRGIFLINEAVRQLRGEGGPAQVPGAEVAVACGSGGWLSCIATVVLGKEGRS